MRVSLKKPSKVDLSKPLLEKDVREYTPEHLTEEIFPNQSLKAYTPEHICEEVIPERVCTLKHIKSEHMPRKKVVSADKQPRQDVPPVGERDIFILVIFAIVVIGVICVCVFALIQEPVEITSSVTDAASDFVALAKKILTSLAGDNLLGFLLCIVVLASSVHFIRQIFRLFRQ